MLNEKIRYLRKINDISQMQIELETDIAFGSISRIESGKVEPTKETIFKIAKALNLSTYDTGWLFGICVLNPENSLIAVKRITGSRNVHELLKNSVDIIFNLYRGFNGGMLFRKVGNYIFSIAVSEMPLINKALGFLGKPLEEHFIDLKDHTENLVAKSVINKRYYIGTDLYQFSGGPVTKFASKMISKVLGFRIGVVFPLIFNNDILGAMLYTKRIPEPFSEEELRILELLSDQLAMEIKKVEEDGQFKTVDNKYLMRGIAKVK